MVNKILICYAYQDKPTLLKIADAILYPTRALLGGKTIEYDPNKNSFREEDAKVTSLFLKIILALVAIPLLPITLIACLIKSAVKEGASIESALTKKLTGECVICWEDCNAKDERTLNCKHVFHKVCIDPWLRKNPTCPTCRASQN